MIRIAQKLSPFSHRPGIMCSLPGSHSILTAYPTRLEIDQHAIDLPLTGPVKNFTVEQDLERDCVFVFGQAKNGYFRLKIFVHKEGFTVEAKKGPVKSFEIKANPCFLVKKHQERLSLGSHKTQDIEMIKRRKDLKEILPLLFLLGQKTPKIELEAFDGTAALLNFSAKKPEQIQNFFDAAFKDLLVPRVFDDEFQGLCEKPLHDFNPFSLLSEAYQRIRALFFIHEGKTLQLLPDLPPIFDAGRMCNIEVPDIGIMHIEWSKKQLRRILLEPTCDASICLKVPKQVRQFRMNRKLALKSGESFEVKKDQKVLLDRFMK